MALKGLVSAPVRTLDVSALTGWLTLRAVEMQTSRLRAIEAAQPKPGTQPPNDIVAPEKQMAPALPAPVEINPVPLPKRAGQPQGSVSPQN
jgi:hypothetical protein